MKKIKGLTIKVKYTVGLGDLEVPEKVFNQLNEMHEEGKELDMTSLDYPEANEWIRDNIKEGDSCDCESEVWDIY